MTLLATLVWLSSPSKAMQQNPLLEQLDWFFTSTNWTSVYPLTEVIPLAKVTSDHIPCKIMINTKIPKSNLFRFENFWTEHSGFFNVIQDSWGGQDATAYMDSAKNLAAKLKSLRQALKVWSRSLSDLNLLIANCNLVISFFDGLEDSRPLFYTEQNLRRLVKVQIAKLLRYKSLYWKKRYTVNRVKLGDENTKFFHAVASISYHRNSIPQLTNDLGAVVHDHDSKADLIWSSFKGRMGVTSNPVMLFNLAELVTSHENLDFLADPFEETEIDGIIRKMPPDKAPGLDGFNGHFMKRCWAIIKQDFYKLCFDFYSGDVSLESINESFITLVPKVLNPESVSDYRPISLLNSSIKLITKILADRLQSIIFQLVHSNQYGFIRGRTIQDCLAAPMQTFQT